MPNENLGTDYLEDAADEISERIWAYLDEHELEIGPEPLGELFSLASEAPVVANHQIIVVTDHERGFSYNIGMPWDKNCVPDLAEVIQYLKHLYAFGVSGAFADCGCKPVSQRNYEVLLGSGLVPHLARLHELSQVVSFNNQPLDRANKYF